MSVVGAGAVGSALALHARRRGFRIACIVGRSRRVFRLRDVFRGTRLGTNLLSLPPHPDILVLAVPEQSLEDLVSSIASMNDIDFSGSVVFHLSGAMTSAALDPLRRRGAKTFSLHPVQLFPASLSVPERALLLRGIPFVFEGGKESRNAARSLVRALGGEFVEIPKERKILYHASCVFASNYLVALHEIVERLVRRTGGGLAPKHLHPLMLQSLLMAFREGASGAITGPIVRGSEETVRRHIRELTARAPGTVSLYRELGRIVLSLAQKTGKPDRRKWTALGRVLAEKNPGRMNGKRSRKR